MALSAAFSVAALVLLLVGFVRLRGAHGRASILQDTRCEVLGYVAQMRHEVALLELAVETASVERLQGLAEECSEALQNLKQSFGNELTRQSGFEQMELEWGELVSAEPQNGWARYATDLSAFGGHFDNVREGLEESLALARQAALAFCGTGVAAAGIAFLLSLWVLLTVLSDVTSESYDPAALEEEVAELAADAQFRTRINLLLPPEERGDAQADWELRTTRRFPEQRTHQCFEAVASRDGKEVKLWGRRYKWAGYAKSFQRVMLPAFAEATWRALCLMHNNALSAPVPVVYKRLRAGPFKAGAIVLMEHVGQVQSVKSFLNAGFCLLDRQEQGAFLQRLVGFLHSLHDLDIYGIKTRYLHGKRLKTPERMQLYLFDLDKVLLWRGCPGLIAGMFRRKDHRRLLRQLEPVVNHARLSEVREWLSAGSEEAEDRQAPSPP